MAPRTEEQFEEIRQEKRKIIMDTALELFANQGYHMASISQIAKKAGISKGLIYNYFDSKESLLKEILDGGFDEMMELFDPNNDGILECHELAYFIEKSIELLKQNIEFWRFYFRVSLQPEVFPIVETKIKEVLAPTTSMIVKYFEAQGFEDPASEALIFGALLDGISMDYVFSPDLFPIDQVKNAIIKRYCNQRQVK